MLSDYLTECWNWAAGRTELLKGAVLVVEKIPAVTYCEECDSTYGTVEHGKICPYCGSGHTYLLQGNETNIKEIEAERLGEVIQKIKDAYGYPDGQK